MFLSCFACQTATTHAPTSHGGNDLGNTCTWFTRRLVDIDCLFIPDNTDMGTCLWGEYAVNAKQSMNTVGFEQGLIFCWKGEKRKRK